ncbi:MAG: hypothetical protein J5I81_05450 [Nitrococcus mobilis]|nr:hypothetical protein [Nitrococcus mobilis]
MTPVKRVKRDEQTFDLFEIPHAQEPIPSSMDYRAPVSALVGQVLRAADCDRYEIAAQVSRLAGKEVSKYMLDAYASESRIDFNIPLWLVAPLESVCNSCQLSNWLVQMRGGRMLLGREVLNAELGKFEQQRAQITEQITKLKKLMGEME